jgi:hypothetical protein
MNGDPDFYIGYLPRSPAELGHFIARAVAVVGLVCIVVAITLVFSQLPFAASSFEYDQYREYEGTLESWPYPILSTKDARFLLAAPGKHGIAEGITDFVGKGVRLKGALIRRDGIQMLELSPGSLHSTGSAPDSSDAISDLGLVILTGEIVDSKCHFGVMNPGNGKVHRDCAARCISGGIPPAFLVRDASGETKTILLTGADRRPLNREVLGFVAEPVQIQGRLIRKGSLYILQTDSKDLQSRQE